MAVMDRMASDFGTRLRGCCRYPIPVTQLWFAVERKSHRFCMPPLRAEVVRSLRWATVSLKLSRPNVSRRVNCQAGGRRDPA